MFVDAAKGVQNCHGLGSYVREVNSEFCGDDVDAW